MHDCSTISGHRRSGDVLAKNTVTIAETANVFYEMRKQVAEGV